MYSGIRAGFFYPFAEPAKHLLAINASATVKAVNALQQLRFQFLNGPGRLGQTRGLVFLETAPDEFLIFDWGDNAAGARETCERVSIEHRTN